MCSRSELVNLTQIPVKLFIAKSKINVRTREFLAEAHNLRYLIHHAANKLLPDLLRGDRQFGEVGLKQIKV